MTEEKPVWSGIGVAEVVGGASLGSPCDFILATGPTADTPQLKNPNEAAELDTNLFEILAVMMRSKGSFI